MAIKGLVFLMNEKPQGNEDFIVRKKYRYIPKNISTPLKTIIELEIYSSNICVVSFYQHNIGNDKTKYKIRSKLGTGHSIGIFKACLEAFYLLDQDYAFIFCAANDLGKIEEDNSRYSAYKLFLSRYFKDYNNYIQQGSITLNTLMLYHQSYQYKNEADLFYNNFEKKVEANLSDDDSDKT